jgi:predicted AlkP superfamily phosphohydrolase/phosphomutase
MNSIQTDSGDDIATTTTTTTTPPQPKDTETTTTSPKPKDTDQDAEVDQQSAKKRHEGLDRQALENAEAGQAREVGAGDIHTAPSGGDGGGRGRRLLLIGLDGAAPELAIGAWRTDLRTFGMLTNRGLRGRLRSSLPWTSAPAWQSLLSGQDPGRLGIYGAERRLNHSYAAPIPIDSHAVQEARLWDILGRAGYQVGVVGAPATTPAPRVQGHLIGDRQSAGAIAAYPESLGRQIALWLGDDLPPQPATGDEIDQIVGEAYARTEQRFWLARRLLARYSYNCVVLCDDGIGTVQRALWHTLDVTHQRYTAQHPFADAIGAFYRFVDDQIGELLEYVDDETVIAIGAANGAQALDGELALNDWLIDQGELRLSSLPARPTRLAECDVDWATTRAWAGDSGAIYLNIAGREPQGSVAPEQTEQLLASLSDRLRALITPDRTAQLVAGPAIEVYRPSALYSMSQGVAPDLLALFSQAGWRTNPLVGYGSSWLSTRTTAMDSAYEAPNGFLILYDPENPGSGRVLEGATIYDVVPTLLALFDEPIPARSRGRILVER